MDSRPAWKGYLRLSLVSLPVRAYSAIEASASSPALHQLHAADDCHARIRYQKTCPVHGEVSNDEIVMGYEYAKGRYVTFQGDELEKVRTRSEKTIVIDAFLQEGALDPLYLRGKSYYLLPDGRAGDRPYALLERAMRESRRQAVAQAILFRREQLVLIRPWDGLLVMSPLYYAAEIRRPADFRDQAPGEAGSADELKLTKMLIDAATPKRFDLAGYADESAAQMEQLVQAKVAGKEVVAPANEPEAPVINLMEALKASMERLSDAGSTSKPAKRSSRRKTPRSSRRKVS